MQCGYRATVHASLFCNRFGIRPEATIEFDVVRVDADGPLVLELSAAKTVPPRFYIRNQIAPLNKPVSMSSEGVVDNEGGIYNISGAKWFTGARQFQTK